VRRVTLRSLWAHKRRVISTVVAIMLGVGFMAGTFILTATLDTAYDDLYGTAYDTVDAVVRGPALFDEQYYGRVFEGVDASALDIALATPGVSAAAPAVGGASLIDNNQLLDSDGNPLGSQFGPTTAFEAWIDNGALNPYRIAAGRPPERDDEVAINVGAAEEGHLVVGDTVRTLSGIGQRTYTLVGTFTFGTATSAGGEVGVAFTLAEAMLHAGLQQRYDRIHVLAEPGVDPDDLVARLQENLLEAGDGNAEVVAGAQAAAEQAADAARRIPTFGFLSLALNIFGVIALVVGMFVITNTFSILLSQRTRELALLRALGASREQVFGSVLLEAAAIGLVASVLGLVLGFLLTVGIVRTLPAVGIRLPSDTPVLSMSAFAAAVAIGTLVTMVSAIAPGVRATEIAPLAALRETSIDRSSGSRARLVAGALLSGLGAWWLSSSWRSAGSSHVIPEVGAGAVLVILGAVIVGPTLAEPSVRTFGRPMRVRGITGRLAVENAARSPKRTSATTSAVLIGVALVTFVTCFAASADRSASSEISRLFAGDIAVQSGAGQFELRGMSPEVSDIVAQVDGVDTVAPGGITLASFTYPNGEEAAHLLVGVDPVSTSDVLRPRLASGDLRTLRDDQLLVDQELARDQGIHIGDAIRVRTDSNTTLLTVAGFSDDRTFLDLLSTTRATMHALDPGALDTHVGVKVEPGVDPHVVLQEIKGAVEAYNVEVVDRDGLIGSVQDEVGGYISLLYALLMLSVVIAVIGVANTMSLSIGERIRELGLLRAVGMDRSDIRASVRLEATLTALLGTGVGILLGVLLSRALVEVMGSIGVTTFQAPRAGLVAIVACAVVGAVVASIRPASRAARASILDAIAVE
jgi:putative ABC transport system permease protein